MEPRPLVKHPALCALSLLAGLSHCGPASRPPVRAALPPLPASPCAGPPRALGFGAEFACALCDDASVRCWGSNDVNQLGAGRALRNARGPQAPTRVLGLPPAVSLAVGQQHACAVTRGAQTYCWGANDVGQLGDGTTLTHDEAVQVSALEAVRQVSSFGRHTCAATANGRAFCWGSNTFGALGDGTRVDRVLPVEAPVLHDVVEVRAGGTFTCARSSEGAVSCWGSNADGQLGDPSVPQFNPAAQGGPLARARAALVPGIPAAAALAAGGSVACVLTREGRSWCWGAGAQGQRGAGGVRATDGLPLRVEGAPALRSIVAGDVMVYGVGADGRAVRWGGAAMETLDRPSAPAAEQGPHAGSFTALSALGYEHFRTRECASLGGALASCWLAPEGSSGGTSPRP